MREDAQARPSTPDLIGDYLATLVDKDVLIVLANGRELEGHLLRHGAGAIEVLPRTGDTPVLIFTANVTLIGERTARPWRWV